MEQKSRLGSSFQKLKCLEIECQNSARFLVPKGTFTHPDKYEVYFHTALLDFTRELVQETEVHPRHATFSVSSPQHYRGRVAATWQVWYRRLQSPLLVHQELGPAVGQQFSRGPRITETLKPSDYSLNSDKEVSD